MILTLFPEMVAQAGGWTTALWDGPEKGLCRCAATSCGSFPDSRGRVDDTVFGGGQGMLLAAEPFARGIDEICAHLGWKPHILYMSPRGKVLDQEVARRLARQPGLLLLCGHYEGVDQRLLEEYQAEEISVGDFVLTGGELPAMIVTDAVSRMLPGVLSEEACFTEESHYSGLLEYPQYTRPEVWRGARCRRCCSLATMKTYGGGGGRRPWLSPGRTARTYGKGLMLQKRTGSFWKNWRISLDFIESAYPMEKGAMLFVRGLWHSMW